MNSLSEMVHASTHKIYFAYVIFERKTENIFLSVSFNISFGWEKRKLNFNYTLLSRGLFWLDLMKIIQSFCPFIIT